jgi:hypothetical protein
VRFEREVEDLFKVAVIDVGVDPEELFVDVFGRGWEGWWEITA